MLSSSVQDSLRDVHNFSITAFAYSTETSKYQTPNYWEESSQQKDVYLHRY